MMLIPGTKSLNARQMVRSPSDAIGSTTSATVCSWSRVVKRRGSSLRDIIHVHLTCTHTSATVTHTRWSECAVADDASHHRWGFLCPHSPIRDSQTIICQRPGTHTHTPAAAAAAAARRLCPVLLSCSWLQMEAISNGAISDESIRAAMRAVDLAMRARKIFLNVSENKSSDRKLIFTFWYL